MSRVPLALAPEVEKQLNREIEEAWHLMQISRGLTAGFWIEVQRAVEREFRLRALLRIRRAARQAAKAIAVAGLLLAAVGTPTAHASEPWTADDTHQALEGAPAVVECIVRLESQYQPYAVGSRGEIGVAQLLPAANGGGQWVEFHEGDWTTLDPAFRSAYDPFLSVAYLEFYLATYGNLAPWSTWGACR